MCKTILRGLIKMFEKYIEVEGFTSFPNSSSKYFLNVNGVVMFADGTELVGKKDKEGHHHIFADLWDGARFYRIKDLMAICFKNVKLPVSLWNEVDGFYIDGNPNNLHASNIGYRFKSGPLECPAYRFFYYIPMFTQYAVNRIGVVLNVRTGYEKRHAITKPNVKRNITGGYFNYGATMDVDRTTMVSRHRALCLVFKPYPDNVDKLDVNHINGIPGDDRLENLEWVTRRRNLTHAYVNNLRTQNKAVLTRDVISGKVTEHYSISEAARSLGYPTDETVRNRLVNGEFSKVWENGIQCKYKDDPRDWILPADPKKAKLESGLLRGVRVRDCRTLKESIYDSVADASRALNISGPTITWQLDKRLTKPHRGYQFKDITDDTEWASFTKDEVNNLDRIAKTVVGRNLLTGDTCYYDSIKSCHSGQGEPRGLTYLLQSGAQRVYSDGWQYKFECEGWRDVTDLDAEMAEGVVDVMARDIFTNRIHIADSGRIMAKALGLDAKTVSMAARAGPEKVYCGYQFRLGVSAKDWPTIPEADVLLLATGTPKSGSYFKFTNKETGTVKYFHNVNDCLTFLSTVKSKAVFFRKLKQKELLDGVWLVTRYRPSCLLDN
jgi:hypothetical protein